MFIDRVRVKFTAGKGGNGVVAWIREKYIPKGGPCGGNGGPGGSVILQADTQISSLDSFRNHRKMKAENGQQGGPNKCQGRRGKDLLLKVPCGTLVRDLESGEILHDLTQDGEKVVLCRGGKGGLGNDHFKSPTRQAPNFCTPGKMGEEVDIELELKIIADVGLVGFPNAGKSTLINSLANLRVKSAAYPFTTLRPNIGFIKYEDDVRLYIADIPGIIKDAHRDKGLGLEFLRHVERTKLLLFVLDSSGIDGRDPLSDYNVLLDELRAYDEELLKRPRFIVLNKIDDDEAKPHIKPFLKKVKGEKIFQISALTGEGLEELIKALRTHL